MASRTLDAVVSSVFRSEPTELCEAVRAALAGAGFSDRGWASEWGALSPELETWVLQELRSAAKLNLVQVSKLANALAVSSATTAPAAPASPAESTCAPCTTFGRLACSGLLESRGIDLVLFFYVRSQADLRRTSPRAAAPAASLG